MNEDEQSSRKQHGFTLNNGGTSGGSGSTGGRGRLAARRPATRRSWRACAAPGERACGRGRRRAVGAGGPVPCPEAPPAGVPTPARLLRRQAVGAAPPFPSLHRSPPLLKVNPLLFPVDPCWIVHPCSCVKDI